MNQIDEASYRLLLLAAEQPGLFGRLRAARVLCGLPMPARDEESEPLDRYEVPALDWSLQACVDLVDALRSGGLLAETGGMRPSLVLTLAGHRALQALDSARAVFYGIPRWHQPDGEAPKMSDSDLVAAIHALMDDEEWSADTTQAIAELLHANGYPISEPAS